MRSWYELLNQGTTSLIRLMLTTNERWARQNVSGSSPSSNSSRVRQLDWPSRLVATTLIMPSSMEAKQRSFWSTSRSRPAAAEQNFGILRTLRFQQLHQRIKFFCSGCGGALDLLARFLHGLADTLLIKWFKKIVYCIDFKGLNGVLIIGGGKHNLRHGDLLIQQLFENAKAIKPGHLHVKK